MLYFEFIILSTRAKLSLYVSLVLLVLSALAIPAHDDLGALWHDRSDDLSVAGGYSYSHSHSSSPLKRRDLHHHHHSPVSVFEGPSSSSPSRSPPASWLAARDRDRLFAGFVRNALGSCVDYAPPTSPRPEVGAGEFAFELDENLAEASPACEPYARELLTGAQDRHRIFHEELVVKAFLEAEKAHRGQDVVHDVAMDYYGKRIATASSDNTIKIVGVSGTSHQQLAT
ncbi:unnamed protein product [Miscanthus lutarioriparius]|uniref:Uncharacterized protein n=1 Tax=Miscanthus lutarioriparius TaxID=422564 RepID=A0A811NQB9_9POAL|nr:unnamed protein product [Miscanthus lutarioriparius]